MAGGFLLSLVIPVQDEEDNVIPLHEEIKHHIDPLCNSEIIFHRRRQ